MNQPKQPYEKPALKGFPLQGAFTIGTYSNGPDTVLTPLRPGSRVIVQGS